MIDTHELTRLFDDAVAVDRLTMRVDRGEILGFLGPNGAGKSTTVKMLTGMIRPTGGTATIAGLDIVTHALDVKRRIGYVPESGAMYESLTAAEHLELVGCLYQLDPATARSRTSEVLEMFGLEQVQHQRLSQFSKGMKQKILIASALIPNPEVLFLDEPLNGLDANAALLVKHLLRKLADQGKTIFFCSHILEVVERICTRIIIINTGQQIIDGTAADIQRATGTESLEAAFSQLTGVRDVGELTGDFLAALETD
jgi:ABC-2 type transport system ATP-binding protein